MNEPQNKERELEARKAAEKVWGAYVRDGVEGWFRFLRDQLKYIPDKAMEPVIVDVAEERNTAVRGCRGAGKTGAGANLLITAMTLVPRLAVLQLSPTWRQVNKIFWNEIRKWAPRSPLFMHLFHVQPKAPEIRSVLSPTEWYAVGLASDMPGTIEGFHNKRVLVIYDEKKSIKDGMIHALKGSLTSEVVWELALSTPEEPSDDYTEFYNCFTKNRARWRTHSIKASDVPTRVPQAWIDDMIDTYGIDSPIVQAWVFAEFPEGGSDLLITMRSAEALFEFDENEEPEGPLSMGIDVARFGMDESVITTQRGDVIVDLKVYSKVDTQELAKTAWALCKSQNIRAVAIDDIGVGGGVTDRITELSNEDRSGYTINIIPFVYSEKPVENPADKVKFVSLGDQVFFQFGEVMRERKLKCSFQDQKLLFQLISFKRKFNKDKIKIEWPKRVTDRQSTSHSPDRAYSVVLSSYAQNFVASPIQTWEDPRKEKGRQIRPEFAGIFGQKF